VVVAEQLHFGRAAELLSIGQPAVSQQVHRLERELGVSLFDRSPRTVRLTEAGRRLLPAARAVLAAAERARLSVRPAGGARRLTLGTSAGLGDHLDRVLGALRVLAPDLSVELVSAPTRARLDRVRAGQLDAAFVRGVAQAPGLELLPVWLDELMVALPAEHALAGQQRIRFADLAGMPLRISPRRANPPLVDLVMTACARAGFEPVRQPGSPVLADTLAAIGSTADTWTVVYAAHARGLCPPRVAFRPAEPSLTLPTLLALRPEPGDGPGLLRQACAAALDHDS
jgi:DNA-binding transcriptional LysR family regulator